MNAALALVERGLVPAPVIRLGIRGLLRRRLREESRGGPAGREAALRALVEDLRASPVALHAEAANAQHYEVPPAFFEAVLGKRLKYSSCLYPPGCANLDEAEEAMLALTAERAGLADGQEVLELGCGWGSLTLWMAERFPRSRVLAVSNSAPQREFILARARERGLPNVEVITADMNGFDTPRRFDRAVSVEMFEHMRNYEVLLRRIAGWLRPGGRLFVHVFCHRELAYPFGTERDDDWMGRHFFTGGIMPSEDLLPRFGGDMVVEERWRVDGGHYARTSEDWLRNLEERRREALAALASTGAPGGPRVLYHRWRVFFMACAELFAFRGGTEWFVAHYRFRRRADAGAAP
ncbi:MAG: cyclopropane-fatty-acyl-phospholipid synthase family protein [Planctomycetes bacterium]|nr:cyclopropane-fatty-acyl-phospholipid synthase family protein [Planctomycetota bacterium]